MTSRMPDGNEEAWDDEETGDTSSSRDTASVGILPDTLPKDQENQRNPHGSASNFVFTSFSTAPPNTILTGVHRMPSSCAPHPASAVQAKSSRTSQISAWVAIPLTVICFALSTVPSRGQIAFIPASNSLGSAPLALTGMGLVSSGNFSLTMNTTELGATTKYTGTAILTITPVDGFDQPVGFQCTGLPAGAACTFSPATVTPNGAPSTDTLTVTYSNPAASLHRIPSPLVPTGVVTCALLCCIGLRKRPIALMAVLAVATLGFAAACGTPNQNLKTYPVTLTASSGSLQHNASFLLTLE